jgi:hypothetical protein
MAQEGLGRLFNIVHTLGDTGYVSLATGSAVTFVCQLDAGDTFTVSSATDAAGTSATALAKVTQFYTAAKTGGVWTKTTQAAASTVVTANSVVAVFTIRHDQLPDGHSYVKCPSTSTGTVLAILHDLNVQRTPANLPSVIA